MNAPLATSTSASVGVAVSSTSWPPADRIARNPTATGSMTVSSIASMSNGGRSTFFLMSP